LDDGTLLAEVDSVTVTTDLNVYLVKSEIRDKAVVDAATWGICIEAAKRTRLVTTQRGVIWMIHPSLTKQYKNNDSQLRYHRLHVTICTDTMYSTILQTTKNSSSDILH
jgi:hypothetical protein